MKLIDEKLMYKKTIKELTIELNNGEVLVIEKTVIDDDIYMDSQNEWQVADPESHQIINNLGEEEYEQLEEFIGSIEV